MKRFLAPYIGHLAIGWRMAWQAKTNLFSTGLTYAVLLATFCGVYRIIPMHELGRPDLQWQHLLWYFAMAEIIIVSVQGNERDLARLIMDGQLISLAQRPGQILVMVLARSFGLILAKISVLMLMAMTLLPLVLHMAWPLSLLHTLCLLPTMICAAIIFLLLGYMTSMLEVFGPYSRPFGWILNKIIFTCGGLLFPILFYPPLVRHLVQFTPAPSIVFATGQFMLHPTGHDLIQMMMLQIFWLLLLLGLALLAQRKMLHHILTHGD